MLLRHIKNKRNTFRQSKSHSLYNRFYAKKVDQEFDLCVLGAGPGGFAGMTKAYDLGKKVCMVSKNVGGAGIHDGALSSKTMWEISEDFKVTNSKRRGYIANNVFLTLDKVRDAVYFAEDIATRQMEHQISTLEIPFYRGTATFKSKNEVIVTNEDEEDVIITAKNFLIATGSTPRTLPDIPTDGTTIFDSDSIMSVKEFPQSIVILGAGVIGCEYATIFSNFKKTKVFVIDKAERILPFEDEDISSLISERMEKKGVTIHHQSRLVYLEKKGEGHVEYCLECSDGKRETFHVNGALLSVGRVPNTADLGLEKIGVKLRYTDIPGETSSPNIFTCGDVTAKIALVSVAELEARNVVKRIFKMTDAPITYNNLSTIMFLDPKIAAVGMNEKILQEKKIEYKIAAYHNSLIGRALAKGKPTGFVKLLVSNDDEMKILGVRALGQHASTMVEIVSYLIHKGDSVTALNDLMSAYPAMTDSLFEAARMFTGSSIKKPAAFQQQTRLAVVTYDEDGNAIYTNSLRTGRYSYTPRKVPPWPIHMYEESFYARPF
eukprot:TRINITY_DN8452_c0_g1_i1.p1 TRINITY_DN8452_c0_g1~~TRINITY_DN8452_c0_g1_i1.p1  ORF type:complete len:548 (+),score=107.24 TRINITY_DN8452_c0_g1_i1:35-1678(+)